MSSTDRLMTIGAFAAAIAGYLLNKGPAANNAQLIFRFGLLGTGVILLVAGLVLKAKYRG